MQKWMDKSWQERDYGGLESTEESEDESEYFKDFSNFY